MEQRIRNQLTNRQVMVRLAGGLFVLLTGAILLVYHMSTNGFTASGNDIWGHLYKSDILYKEIEKGNWFPLYTKTWYNGVQPFRYWAPLSYYIMSGLRFLAGGDLMQGYCFFAGFSYLVGGIGWLLWGKSSKRTLLCTVIGALWFFFPENFRVFFCEGNLPSMTVNMMIPYLAYFVWRYLENRKIRALAGVFTVSLAMTFSHVMLSAMAGIVTFLFLFIRVLSSKQWKELVHVIATMLLSYIACGIWLVPALSGGIVGMNSDSTALVMESMSQMLAISINPVNRMTGVVDTFYFGLSILVISIIGILLAKKGKRTGFYLAVIVLLITSTAAVPILSKLPMSQLLWPTRFATLAYGYFLWSLIEWKSLRNYVCIGLLAILVLDLVPTININRYYTQGSQRTEDEVAFSRDITNQRVAIMDLSAYGSYPSYGLCQGANGVDYTYGWAWQGATTAPNIVMANTAMEAENYLYVFDRAIELGNDTVIIRKDLVGKASKTETDLLEGAEKSGFELEKETPDTYIFHRDGYKTFGVVTEYKGLAIGKYANTVELYYPCFTTGSKTYLDEYSYEELSRYKVLFLSGFEYRDRKKAEQLVEQLGKAGVKVLIDMTHIPVDTKTKRMHFMGVSVQDITFDKRFPTLFYGESAISTLDFAEDNATWNTGYIEGVKNVTGHFNYSGESLTFAGTNEDADIMFVGLNVMFHSTQTGDKNMFSILSGMMHLGYGELPKREEVPISVATQGNEIRITSNEDHVNTTLAALDTFEIVSGKATEENNLLYVNRGTTVIRVIYPMLKAGIVVSIIGFCMTGAFWIFIWRWSKRKKGELKHAKE